jgi:hypothetical protein
MWSRLALKQYRMRWTKRWLTEFDTRGNWVHVGEYLSMLIKQFRRSIWTHEKRWISISNLSVGFSRWGVSNCANISPFRADCWHFTLSCFVSIYWMLGCRGAFTIEPGPNPTLLIKKIIMQNFQSKSNFKNNLSHLTDQINHDSIISFKLS